MYAFCIAEAVRAVTCRDSPLRAMVRPGRNIVYAAVCGRISFAAFARMGKRACFCPAKQIYESGSGKVRFAVA
jgi:hypothetical protein